MGIGVTAVVALAVGYLLGRLRPWRRLGDWAADQVRFTGAWVRLGAGRQVVVFLVHVVTAPRTNWRVMHAPGHRDSGAGSHTRSGLGRQRTQTDEEARHEHRAARGRVRPGAGPHQPPPARGHG
ncbi:hypothetical protein ACRJ4W_23765, partial [Streptomyces sp. GLT-R25]